MQRPTSVGVRQFGVASPVIAISIACAVLRAPEVANCLGVGYRFGPALGRIKEARMSVWSELFSGGAGALLVLGVQKGGTAWADRRDSTNIYRWLEGESKIEGSPDFRSTRTIASHTNLPEDRVRAVCSRHPRIYLSTGTQADLWTIKERSRNPKYQMHSL